MKTRFLTCSLALCAALAVGALSMRVMSVRAADAAEAAGSQFHCRKLSGGGSGLSDLKDSLVQNCNLDKPFSFSSVSLGIGGGSQFVLCCTTK